MLANFVLPVALFGVASRFVAFEAALPTAEILNTALFDTEKKELKDFFTK